MPFPASTIRPPPGRQNGDGNAGWYTSPVIFRVAGNSGGAGSGAAGAGPIRAGPVTFPREMLMSGRSARQVAGVHDR